MICSAQANWSSSAHPVSLYTTILKYVYMSWNSGIIFTVLKEDMNRFDLKKNNLRSLIKTKESWIFQILRLLFYFTLQRGLNLHTRMHLTNELTKNEALPSINLSMLRWLGGQQVNQHNLEFRTFFTWHKICENGKSCNFICVSPRFDSKNS